MWGSKSKTTAAKPATKTGMTKKTSGTSSKAAPAKKTSTKSKGHHEEAKVAKVDKQEQELESIFKIYATDKEMGRDIIGGDGIVNLCNDWKFDLASSAELLVFMWHCECEEYGQISFSEFRKGCNKLDVKDFTDFKSRIPKKLSAVLGDIRSSDFRAFYKFVFCFHREGGAKNVEVGTCHSLLNMIFSDNFPLLQKFIAFTEEKGVTHLTLDQWEGVYDLLKENPVNLDNYDLMAAWPSLLDEFYEWYQKK